MHFFAWSFFEIFFLVKWVSLSFHLLCPLKQNVGLELEQFWAQRNLLLISFTFFLIIKFFWRFPQKVVCFCHIDDYRIQMLLSYFSPSEFWCWWMMKLLQSKCNIVNMSGPWHIYFNPYILFHFVTFNGCLGLKTFDKFRTILS